MSNNDMPQRPQESDVIVGGGGPNMPPSGTTEQGFSYRPNGGNPASKQFFDSGESSKLTPQVLILLITHGLKRNWKWAIPLGLILGFIACGTIYAVFPIKYEATAFIQIFSNKQFFVFDEKTRTEYKNLVDTQFAIIKNPLILDKALENPEVAQLKCVKREDDPATWLKNELSIRTQNHSEIATISIITEVPTDAEKLVNAVVDAYFAYLDDQTNSFNRDLVSKLTLEMNRQQSAAGVLQNQIRRTLEQAAQDGGIAGEKGGMAAGLGQGESLLRDVLVNESTLISLQAELKMLQESSNEQLKIPPALLESAVENDPVLVGMRNRKADLEQRVEELKDTIVRSEDPRISLLRDNLDKINKQINDYQSKVGETKFVEIQRTNTLQLQGMMFEMERKVRAQEILVSSLQDRYTKQLTKSGDRTKKVVDVTFQEDQLRRINTVLDQLSTRLTSLTTELNAPAQIQLKKRAVLPRAPLTEKRLPLAIVGGLAGFFFPLFLGIAIERIKPRLYHASQVRRALPTIMIGEIMEPPVSWVHGPTFKRRLGRYRETVHNWCTHLLLSDPYRSCRTLAIASVAADDGKTFLAIQVAVAMAQMKSGPVLLIDGDMRVGRLHLLFGNEEPGIGLADVLSFRNRIGEAVVQNENEPNLHLLSCGNLDISPYELLGDGRFRELLDALEQNYAMILVVVPPVSYASEALIMSASTDTTLLCVRQSQTVLAAMEDVFRKLVTTGSSVDGIVIKDIPYSHMAYKDGGFADKLEQIRLAHLIQYEG